ncbi:MAG: zinc ribbon domain-containing protein [Bacillus sp. (in: Bacteria)]|nr:zinc ribbon domain-containing protein [Bacillus sp. (in: firmicutes)]
MPELQDKIGSGLIKIQDGIETGKKKLESSRKVYSLNKELGEAGEAKGKLYFKMGQQAYNLLRTGNIQDDLLKNLGNEMMELDKKIWQLTEELSQFSMKTVEKSCPKCGQKITGDGKFCSFCGNMMEDQLQKEEVGQPCVQCNTAVPVQAQFCPCCGRAIGGGNHVL